MERKSHIGNTCLHMVHLTLETWRNSKVSTCSMHLFVAKSPCAKRLVRYMGALLKFGTQLCSEYFKYTAVRRNQAFYFQVVLALLFRVRTAVMCLFTWCVWWD